jgi:hypothetical protein
MATTNKAPKMYDTDVVVQAGIDPTTGLPIKAGDDKITCLTKSEIKKQLRILDEQDAVNRFTWYNLPKGLNGRLIERILYYKGQGMFFKLGDNFYFLPYSLDGTIDVYGRFVEVTPLPFNGTASAKSDGKERPWVIGLKRKVLYDVELPEDYINQETGEILVDKIKAAQENSCVLIKDYTEQISQTNIARQILQDPVLDVMSDMFPFMRTALLNGTGVQGMKVNDQGDQANVEIASRSVNQAALTGKKWIAMVGSVDFQDLTGGQVAKAEEYLLAMQSLDNYRLSLYGLSNGGLFQKKSHMLEAEQNMNTGNNGLILNDSLKYRQEACNIINSVWGLNVWCETSEVVLNIDKNGDMQAGGDETAMAQETTTEQTEVTEDEM